MPYYLRSIRQRRWFQHPDIPWLPQGELQGDALLDLQPKDNSLSIYEVRNEAEERRVAVALAANRDNLDVFDYAIFEGTQFPTIGVNVVPCEGETPDAEVNSFHHDLRQLTVHGLVGLAEVISTGKQNRIPRKTLKSRLVEAIKAGTLHKDKMKTGLLSKLQ